MGKMAHPSALSSPGSHQLPRAAPGRPGGCLHVEDGTSVCSPLPWWPPSSPGQLRAGLATAGRLHREDVPSAALPSLGGHPAPQGCSGPAGRLPASSMGKMVDPSALPSLACRSTENKEKPAKRPTFSIAPIARATQPNAPCHQNPHGNSKSPYQRPGSEYATGRRTGFAQYPSL